MEGILILYFGPDYITGTLFSSAGSIVKTVKKEISLILDEEYAEQDPEEWYYTVTGIISEIQGSVEDIMINYISVTYQPGTFVCIDRSGKPLMNAILPFDRRAKYQVHIFERISKKHSDNSGMDYGLTILPKLLWIKYNKPDIYSRIFKVLTPDGYISYRLTGESAIDSYSAGFLGYNQNTGSYNKRLLNLLEIDNTVFPEIKKMGDCAGIIGGELTQNLKLRSEIKLIISSNILVPLFYTISNSNEKIIAYDAESSNICFSCGSESVKEDWNQIKLQIKEIKYYGIMGNYEGLFLRWLDKVMKYDDNDSKNYSPGSHGVISLPCMMGDISLYKSDLKGSIIGISNNNSYDMVTAGYEAIGYIVRERLECISRDINLIEVLGPIEDRLFYRILSDITGRKVLLSGRNLVKCIFNIITHSAEEEDANTITIYPDENKGMIYRQLYSLYKNACDSLNDICRYRRKVMRKIIQ